MDNREVQSASLYLAKKFGFVPRSVVWEFISPVGRTARYKHWRLLQSSPLFSPYILGSGFPEYLILSQAGRKYVGEEAVTEVPTVYLAHDEIVMRFYCHLQKMTIMEQAWSENELKMDRVLAIKGLGDGVIGKLPDLLFDLKMEKSFLRCALEIERTRKSLGRYQTMRRSYQRAANVDLIIFGVADEKIEAIIRKEVAEAGLDAFGKEIGFFDLVDFEDRKFQAPLRIAGRELSLERFFISLTKTIPDSADSARHGVRAELEEGGEAA
ncbi:MAG TPA: hypothetical protein VN132_12625 [Bdellovibrio sp.]|nr:hypothetical protein [Bdellovibrio sp.]